MPKEFDVSSEDVQRRIEGDDFSRERLKILHKHGAVVNKAGLVDTARSDCSSD